MMSTLTCSGVSSAERSCCLASSDQGGPSDPFPNPHKPKQEPSVPMVHRLPPKPDLQAKSPPPCPRGSSGGTPPNPPPSSSCGPQSVGGKTRRFILEFGPSSIGGPSAIILFIQQHLHHFLRPAAEGKQSNNAPGLHWPRSVLWWKKITANGRNASQTKLASAVPATAAAQEAQPGSRIQERRLGQDK